MTGYIGYMALFPEDNNAQVSYQRCSADTGSSHSPCCASSSPSDTLLLTGIRAGMSFMSIQNVFNSYLILRLDFKMHAMLSLLPRAIQRHVSWFILRRDRSKPLP